MESVSSSTSVFLQFNFSLGLLLVSSKLHELGKDIGSGVLKRLEHGLLSLLGGGLVLALLSLLHETFNLTNLLLLNLLLFGSLFSSFLFLESIELGNNLLKLVLASELWFLGSRLLLFLLRLGYGFDWLSLLRSSLSNNLLRVIVLIIFVFSSSYNLNLARLFDHLSIVFDGISILEAVVLPVNLLWLEVRDHQRIVQVLRDLLKFTDSADQLINSLVLVLSHGLLSSEDAI